MAGDNFLVVGDAGLSPFYVDSTTPFSPGEMFKIARKIAQLEDLVKTTLFFLNKFSKVETVIFHGGTTTMRRGNTEKIKECYTNLIYQITSRDIKLIISGPFPNSSMSSQMKVSLQNSPGIQSVSH